MDREIKTCKRCILTDEHTDVSINADGICNFCEGHKSFQPNDNSDLIKLFEKVKKKKKGLYDALVPLSGGKDSTYVLYLAVKKYGLNVLTYTFDNGFVSELAKENIETSVKTTGVDHIWVRPNQKVLDDFYRTSVLESGEICNVCGIGIERSMLKITEAYKIPFILMGHSPVEDGSASKVDIYDHCRFKTILSQNKEIKTDAIDRFLIYPDLNYITTFLHTKLGKFGRKIKLLYYEDLPSDKEIAEILKDKMDWKDASYSEYTRHFDCLAEPFSNYIRDRRFGMSRRLPQLCSMIRNGEISREEAFTIHKNDTHKKESFSYVLNRLRLSEKDLEKIESISEDAYSENYSKANRLFAKVRSRVHG